MHYLRFAVYKNILNHANAAPNSIRYEKTETQSLKGFKDTSLHMSTLSQGINQQVGDTATADTIPRFFKRT